MTHKSPSKLIPIFFSTDDNYAPYLGVAISSLVTNCSPEHQYKIHILHDNLSSYYQKSLSSLAQSNVEICYVAVNSFAELIKQFKLPENTELSQETFYRILIPLLFKDYDKLVYCDCDIIFKSDIAELYNIDTGDNYFAAAPDLNLTQFDQTGYIKNTLKLKFKEQYCNAGVLVFNNKKILQDNFVDQCFATLAKLKCPIYADQDIINVTANGHIKLIPNCFNYQWHLFFNHDDQKTADVRIPDADIKILHFTTLKPWECPKYEYSEYFWEYARKTRFYEEIIYKHSEKNLKFNSQYLLKIINISRSKIKYWQYKLLSKVTFGKLHKSYKTQYKKIKQNLKQIRSFIKYYTK